MTTPATGRAFGARGPAAPPCAHCDEAPPMRDWAGLPADARHVGADPETGAPRLCGACWAVAYRDPARLARVQALEALDALARPASAFVRWPFRALDATTGPLAPGTVHYVGAASGGGKTTFVTSAIEGWAAAGVRVAVLPLEAEGWAWRTQLACVRCGVPPGDVLSGALIAHAEAGDPDAARALDAVRAELRAMSPGRRAREAAGLPDRPSHDVLAVFPDRRLTAARVRQALAWAAAHLFQVVVIDHIDHIEDGGADPGGGADGHGRRGSGGNALDESRRVNAAVLDGAQAGGLVVVAMSQLNAARFAGHRDRLAKYGVPAARDFYLHTYKEHAATSMLGLFRPVQPGLDADVLARARAGDVEPGEVLAPGTMGVALVKSRPYGAREGQRAYLAVERGAARDRTEDEARAWEAAAAGIGTGDDLSAYRTASREASRAGRARRGAA